MWTLHGFSIQRILKTTSALERMPKKGSAAGGSKKDPVQSASKEDDGSYIIFGTDNPNKKQKKAKAGTNQQVKLDGALVGEDAPKMPDTRRLIGGASWTGKLPVNMLSEHCQKQKWAKPEYSMV